MPRVLALVLTAACLVTAGQPAAQQVVISQPGRPGTAVKPDPKFFEALLAQYAAGELDVLTKTLVDPKKMMEFHNSLQAVLAAKDDPKNAHPWTRARAAFILEAAIFSSTHFATDVVPCVSAGRLMVMKRPALLGLDPSEDAFEAMWHRIALALLQRMGFGEPQQIYLDTIERRYSASAPGQPAKPAFDPRFVLYRVIADEQAAFQAETLASGQARTTRLTALVKPGDKSKLASYLRHGIKASEEAMTLPDVAVEATLRRAAIFIKLAQFEDALTAARKVDRKQADDVQRYWVTLLEARALQELKRLPEAERTYRDAADAWPEASAPITGLALVLFDMNRRTDALAAAASLRRQEPTGRDPWWNYNAADSRFVTRWRDEMRGMLQ